MGSVVIGVDLPKRSATIEIINDREQVLDQGRFGTGTDGYRQMLAMARRWPDRTWAVQGCNGIGKHLAQRLVADGETVLDVPAKLSARARVFSTGQGRKTDATDAHSVAVVGLRSPGLRQVRTDDHLVALRLLVDRRDDWASLAPTPSTGCIACCWSLFPVVPNGSCPPRRLGSCWPASGLAMWSARLAGNSLPS